jgi:hypothetical protein
MRNTCDVLAVEHPIWMIDDCAYDTLGCNDFLLPAGIVPIARHKPRNTDDPLDIEYGVEDRFEKHSEDVQLKRSVLDETYNRRTRSNGPIMRPRTATSGTSAPEAASTYGRKCSNALFLRVAVAITNDERGYNPGREMLKA